MGIYIYTIPVIQYIHVHVEPYCCGFVSMIWAMWVSACMLFNYRKCIKTSLHLWICYMISEFVIKKVSMMLLGILFSFYWLMNYLLSFIWLSYLNSKLNSYQMLRLSYLIWRNKKSSEYIVFMFFIFCVFCEISIIIIIFKY